MTEAVPAWLEVARKYLGVEEVRGPGNNPAILNFIANVSARFPEMARYAGNYTSDDTAWCGVFAANCLAETGRRPPFDPADDLGSFMWANAWQDHGTRCAAKVGAVACFSRHVGFVNRVIDGDTVEVIGGNQSSPGGGAVTLSKRSDAIAFRWPPEPTSQQQPKVPTPGHTMIKVNSVTATVFGGPSDPINNNATAYGFTGGPEGWSSRLGVALPIRISGERPSVRLTNVDTGLSVIAPVVDVGPWNKSDDWYRTGGRPRVEAQFRNRTQDDYGRIPTNDAGIDLTPATASAIGLKGKGKVDVEIMREGDVDEIVARPTPGGLPAEQGPPQLAQVMSQLVALASYSLIKDDLPADQREAIKKQLLASLLQVSGAAPIALPPPKPPIEQPATPPPTGGTSAARPGFWGSLIALAGAAFGMDAGAIGTPFGMGQAPSLTGTAAIIAPLLNAGLSYFGAYAAPAKAGLGIARVLGGWLQKLGTPKPQ